MYKIIKLRRGMGAAFDVALNIKSEIRAEELLDELSKDDVTSEVVNIKTCKHNILLQFSNGNETLFQINHM